MKRRSANTYDYCHRCLPASAASVTSAGGWRKGVVGFILGTLTHRHKAAASLFRSEIRVCISGSWHFVSVRRTRKNKRLKKKNDETM